MFMFTSHLEHLILCWGTRVLVSKSAAWGPKCWWSSFSLENWGRFMVCPSPTKNIWRRCWGLTITKWQCIGWLGKQKYSKEIENLAFDLSLTRDNKNITPNRGIVSLVSIVDAFVLRSKVSLFHSPCCSPDEPSCLLNWGLSQKCQPNPRWRSSDCCMQWSQGFFHPFLHWNTRWNIHPSWKTHKLVSWDCVWSTSTSTHPQFFFRNQNAWMHQGLLHGGFSRSAELQSAGAHWLDINGTSTQRWKRSKIDLLAVYAHVLNVG